MGSKNVNQTKLNAEETELVMAVEKEVEAVETSRLVHLETKTTTAMLQISVTISVSCLLWILFSCMGEHVSSCSESVGSNRQQLEWQFARPVEWQTKGVHLPETRAG